ncbi:carbohydrate ABC transporter permease [Demequina maris]|uniref:carbohydrate ABC transporter permease n=1 Tax=Demequina maris TaxID=1638982 RepID=UPI0007818B7A|nr:carbohydrate ABC transporter permease [Demequina maris]
MRSKTQHSGETRRGPGGYATLIVAAFLTLVPFLVAVIGSLRTTADIGAHPLGLPIPPVWDNYRSVIGSSSFWVQLGNSVLVATLTVVLVLFSASLAAFALSRFQFRGRETVYGFFTLGLLFPASVGILPLYLMVRNLGLLDTPIGVALPQAAFALPVTIVILRPFFQSIPRELEEAAAVDGAGRMRFFWRILLPMSVPALITVGILALVQSWNSYVLPLLLLTSNDHWTLPLGVAQFSGSYLFDTAGVLAYTVMAIIPTLVAYSVAERFIVEGLTAGAVKG